MGCHSFLQGIFLTRGLNLGPPHGRQILNCLSHQGSLVTEGASDTPLLVLLQELPLALTLKPRPSFSGRN